MQPLTLLLIALAVLLPIQAESIQDTIQRNLRRRKCTARNTFWNKCASPCDKVATCDDPEPCLGEILPAVCVKKCECKRGFLYSEDHGRCVKTENCPVTIGGTDPDDREPATRLCTNGRVWSECAPACNTEATCDNPNPCPTDLAVCEAKCACPPGQTFDTVQAMCVPTEMCPQECSGGRVWNSCGSACAEEATCANQDPCPNSMTVCEPKCECPSGQVFDEGSQTCVHHSMCPTACEGGRVWNTCASACPLEPSCGNQDPCADMFFPAVCVEKCTCPTGRVWSSGDGMCVPATNC